MLRCPARHEECALTHRVGLGKQILLIAFSLAFAVLPGSDAWAGAAAVGSGLAADHRLLSAIPWLEAAAARPGGEPARARLGSVLLRRGRPEEAARELRLAVAGGAGGPRAFADLARAQTSAGDAAGGLETLRAALARYPGDADLWTSFVERAAGAGLGCAEIRASLAGASIPAARGALGQRVAYLKAACIAGPETDEGMRLLRQAAQGPDSRLADAAGALLDAATSDPAVRRLAIANALVGHALPGPALSYLDGELRGELEAERLALLGHTLALVGRPDEARDSLARSLELDPGLQVARLLLGSILRASGEVEPAVTLLEQAARARPPDPRAYVELAKALAEIGDYGTAEQALGIAVQIAPDDGDLHLTYADFYVSRQYRVEKALRGAAEAVRLLGRTPATLGTLGWGLHLAGRSREALPVLQEAVEMEPESALLRYRLGSVYEGLGLAEQARQQYMMVRELDGTGSIWNRARAALEGL